MLEYYTTIEDSIKKHILDKYHEFLTKDQISLLHNKSYLTNETEDTNDLFNNLAFSMFNDLLNHECHYKLEIEDDAIFIPCFNRLKELLINYYLIDLSKYLKFKPLIDNTLLLDIDEIRFLNISYDNIIDKNVFGKTAIELEQIDEIEDFVHRCIDYDVKKYLDNSI